MSLSFPESSGDASQPFFHETSRRNRNFPPPAQTNNVVGHIYWCPPTLIAEITPLDSSYFLVSVKFYTQSAFYIQSAFFTDRHENAEQATRTCQSFVYSIVKITRFYDDQTWPKHFRNSRGTQSLWASCSWLYSIFVCWLAEQQAPITWTLCFEQLNQIWHKLWGTELNQFK